MEQEVEIESDGHEAIDAHETLASENDEIEEGEGEGETGEDGKYIV